MKSIKNISKLFLVSTVLLLLLPRLSFSEQTQDSLQLSKLLSSHSDIDSALRKELERLYERSANQPIWSTSGTLTSQSLEAIQSIQQSPRMGLNPQKYSLDQLKKSRNNLSSSTSTNTSGLAEFDVNLSIALMQFISDLYLGQVDPRETGFDLVIKQKDSDLAEIIFALSHSDSMWADIKQLEPHFKIYQRLKEALSNYRQFTSNYKWQQLSADKVIHPGDQYQDLNRLVELLIAVQDLDSAIPVNEVYEGELVDAVKHFQQRHGLEADGVIGNKTFQQLNKPLTKRIEQIELAMERLRWLSHLKDSPYIVVNIPAFELYAFQVKDSIETLKLKMNVVVGSAVNKHETPVFMADMKYLVFRPYWNVPRSIIVRELMPKMKRDPDYLRSRHYEIVQGNTVVSSGSFNQEMINGLRSGKLRIRQQPGERNALGQIKFIFPNSNSVYLHDTPSRHLFKRSRRDFSHGCIRVEDPARLAEFVLGLQDQGWDRDAIDRAFKGKDDHKINLVNQIPVYIFYTTVTVRENGDIVFFDDIYGHDAQLAKLLKLSSQ